MKKKTRVRRRRMYSSEDDWSDESEIRRTTRGGKEKRVDYKEASSDGGVRSEDVLEWEDEVVPSTSQTVPESEVPCEAVEKVLNWRLGRYGAIGPPTTCYNVEDKGDPNAALLDSEEKERQYLIKWIGWAHIHNTWESEAAIRQSGVKGIKKLENFINRVKEIDAW